CFGRELTGFVHALTQTNDAHIPMQFLDPRFGVLCNQYSHRVGSSINGGHWSGPCFSMLDRVCFACTAQPFGVPRYVLVGWLSGSVPCACTAADDGIKFLSHHV